MVHIHTTARKKHLDTVVTVAAFVILGGIVVVILGMCLLGGSKIANGFSPIHLLRTISSAQELYRSRNDCYGDYFDLLNIKYIDLRLARTDPDHPEHQEIHGYNFDIQLNKDKSDWCCIATPERWSEDGSRNWKIDSKGIIWINNTKGDTTNFPKALGED